MTPITYIIGDATRPAGIGNKVIVHCCNDVGGWGAGFVLALSRRWPEPEASYRAWAEGEIVSPEFKLGAVQFVPVSESITVANLIGQSGCGFFNGKPPVRYEAICTGLRSVAAYAGETKASVHMPKMGAGLAGGDWGRIESLIRQQLSDQDIPVIVYTLG